LAALIGGNLDEVSTLDCAVVETAFTLLTCAFGVRFGHVQTVVNVNTVRNIHAQIIGWATGRLV